MFISIFKSIHDAYLASSLHQVELSWPDAAELFMQHIPSDTKETVPLFNLVRFRSLDDPEVELGRKYIYKNGKATDEYRELAGTIRRSKYNLVSLSGIVLDFDDGYTLEQAIEDHAGLEYVLYTTFRHRIDHHKFRMILPFKQELLAADIPIKQRSIIETFSNANVDRASFSISQSFYFHSGPNDSIVYHNHGVMLDPYTDFEDYHEPEPEPFKILVYDGKNYVDHSQLTEPELMDLLQRVQQRQGDFSGRYSEFLPVAWALCSQVGPQRATEMLRQFWPRKTDKERKLIQSWKPDKRGYTVATLIKLAGHNPVFDRLNQPKERDAWKKKKSNLNP
jgi:hypothetical protein